MNDNSASLLLTLLCCFGFMGVLFAGGVILAVILWPKSKAASSAPNQIPPASASQAPLPVKPTLTPPPKPPPEAMEHFERASKMEVREGDQSALNEQASEYALAIKKANGFFPAAHAWLGVTLAMLGYVDKARQELNTAVQQENCNTLARAFLILMDIDKLGMPNVPRNTGSLLVDMVSLGGGLAIAQGKLSGLSGRIDELVRAYPEDISGSDKIEYWIAMSEIMLQVHDAIQSIKALSRKDRLARAVMTAPWEKITVPSEYEQKVNDLKRRAEGRVSLAK